MSTTKPEYEAASNLINVGQQSILVDRTTAGFEYLVQGSKRRRREV